MTSFFILGNITPEDYTTMTQQQQRRRRRREQKKRKTTTTTFAHPVTTIMPTILLLLLVLISAIIEVDCSPGRSSSISRYDWDVRLLQQDDFCTLCKERLETSDADGDGALSAWEYRNFSQQHGLEDGITPPSGGNNNTNLDLTDILPLELLARFNQLACACTLYVEGGNASCCLGDEAAIPLSVPNDTSYPCDVCAATQDTVDHLNEQRSNSNNNSGDNNKSSEPPNIFVDPPTHAPIASSVVPTTSTRPSMSMIPSLSMVPSPVAPTIVPSTIPSIQPSIYPTTGAPTSRPTMPDPILIQVDYNIVVPVGTQQSFVLDLMAAMDLMAPRVLEINDSGDEEEEEQQKQEARNRNFRQRRMLRGGATRTSAATKRRLQPPFAVGDNVTTTTTTTTIPTNSPTLSPTSSPTSSPTTTTTTTSVVDDDIIMVQVDLPTWIYKMDQYECQVASQQLECHEVGAGIHIINRGGGDHDDELVQKNVTLTLELAIQRGDLTEALQQFNSNTSVRIVDNNYIFPTTSPTTSPSSSSQPPPPPSEVSNNNKTDDDKEDGFGLAAYIGFTMLGLVVLGTTYHSMASMRKRYRMRKQYQKNKEWYGRIGGGFSNYDNHNNNTNNIHGTNTAEKTSSEDVLGDSLVRRALAAIEEENSSSIEDMTPSPPPPAERRHHHHHQEEEEGEEDTASRSMYGSSSDDGTTKSNVQYEEDMVASQASTTIARNTGTTTTTTTAGAAVLIGRTASSEDIPPPAPPERKPSRQPSHGDSGAGGSSSGGWVTYDLPSSSSISYEEDESSSLRDINDPSSSSPEEEGDRSLKAPVPNQGSSRESQEWTTADAVIPPFESSDVDVSSLFSAASSTTSSPPAHAKFLTYPEKKKKNKSSSKAAKLMLAQSSDDDVPLYEDNTTGSDTDEFRTRSFQHWNATADIFVSPLPAKTKESGIPGIHILESSSASTSSSNNDDAWESPVLPLPKPSLLHHRADAAAGPGTPTADLSLFQMATAPSQSKRKMIYRARTAKKRPSQEQIMDELGPVG